MFKTKFKSLTLADHKKRKQGLQNKPKLNTEVEKKLRQRKSPVNLKQEETSMGATSRRKKMKQEASKTTSTT